MRAALIIASISALATAASPAPADEIAADRAAPLIRVQATDPALCGRRCDFDHETCVKVVRENCWNPLGGCGLPPERSEFGRAALQACADGRRYCYRNCERP
jgi:hypothetical protein